MATELKTKILLRRGALAAVNYVLDAGEPGFDTTSKVFKIGDGSSTWEQLKAYTTVEEVNAVLGNYYTKTEINALEQTLRGLVTAANTSISNETTARQNADNALGERIDGVSERVTTIENLGITAEKVSAWDGVVRTVNTNKSDWDKAKTAVQSEDFETFKTNNTKAIEDAVKAEAEARATAISNLSTSLGAKIEGLETADEQQDGKIAALETKLANVTNVMDFVGQRTVTVSDEGVISVTPLEGETFHKGDVVVDNSGKEYVYDGSVWAEFGSTTAADSAITALQGRMTAAEGDIEALEGRMNTAEGDIEALEGHFAAEGRVTKAESAIDELEATVQSLGTSISNETTARKDKDDELELAINTKVSDVVASGADIVISKENNVVTVAHKTYGTGEYKAPADATDDGTKFVTSINVSNGHVTGASVKSLAEALAAMEFILDGGEVEAD